MMKKWNAQVEKMLDQPNHTLDFDEFKKAYQPELDNQRLENISYIFSGVVTAGQIPLLFTQLSSFFEVGFLIEKTGSKNIYTAHQIFAFSKHLNQLDAMKTIRLPDSELFQVMKTNAKAFLSKFALDAMDAENRMSAFLVRLTDHHSIVIMSSLAEPWLQLRIESLQKTLMRVHFDS